LAGASSKAKERTLQRGKIHENNAKFDMY